MTLAARRITFAVSTVVSIFFMCLYLGLDLLGFFQYGVLYPIKGPVLSGELRIIAIPLVLLLLVGGGLAAAYSASDDTVPGRQRWALALTAPPGIMWIFVFAVGLGSLAEGVIDSVFSFGLTSVTLWLILRQMSRCRVLG